MTANSRYGLLFVKYSLCELTHRLFVKFRPRMGNSLTFRAIIISKKKYIIALLLVSLLALLIFCPVCLALVKANFFYALTLFAIFSLPAYLIQEFQLTGSTVRLRYWLILFISAGVYY